jgi:hypothetical protein
MRVGVPKEIKDNEFRIGLIPSTVAQLRARGHQEGAIPNLPAELAVEVPVSVEATGVHPVSLGRLPDPIAKLMSMAANVQQLAVEAAVHASKELALQALLIDPVVNSATSAVQLLDELWEINRPYIRKCAARAAGAIAIGVLTGPAPAASLVPDADAILASAEELLTWLDQR